MKTTNRFQIAIQFLSILLASTIAMPSARAITLSAEIPATDYGYLDQYNLNAANDFVGNEACVPTSTTNALTYLQNVNPGIFGSGSLTGTTYASWQTTDQTLINIMGTKPDPNGGTHFYRLPDGINQYLSTLPTNYSSNIRMSGQFTVPEWTPPYTQPSYIATATPTPTFIYDALVNNAAVLMSISYSDDQGSKTNGAHELLVNGISWDTDTNSGTISFIDPLNPSATYTNLASDGITYQPDGPAMATTGTISLLDSGSGDPGYLLLSYSQYGQRDTVPHDQSNPDDFHTSFATIDDILSVTAIPEPSSYGALIFLTLALRSAVASARRAQPPYGLKSLETLFL